METETSKLTNEEIVELYSFISKDINQEQYCELYIKLRKDYDLTTDIIPLELYILSQRDKFPVTSLLNIYKGLKDVTFETLILDLVSYYQTDNSAAVYVKTIEEIFNYKPEEIFSRKIINFIDNSDMVGVGAIRVRDHFQHILNTTSKFAEVPTYIKNYNVTEIPKMDIKTDNLLEKVENYLTNFGDKVNDKIKKRIEKLDEDDKKLYSYILSEDNLDFIRNNDDIFRVHGPVNPYLDTTDPNMEFGGARMFLDTDMEYDEEGDKADEWFIGYCIECSKRIRKYHHAVREPFYKGGWRGCYCSWKCIIDFFEEDAEIGDPHELEIYETRKALVNFYSDQIYKIGIDDR